MKQMLSCFNMKYYFQVFFSLVIFFSPFVSGFHKSVNLSCDVDDMETLGAIQ